MQTPAIIRDGYTRPGFIAARQYLSPAVRFKYRPMLVAERDAINSAVNKMTAEQSAATSAQAMAARIVEWDVRDGANPAPISAANILRLEPGLFNTLYLIIAGAIASDPDPKWSDSEASAEASAALHRAIHGDVSTAIQEGEAVKN